MIVFDTNVLSELMRPQPDPQVMAWANGLDPQAISITIMNEADILYGIARPLSGRRQEALQQSWQRLMASLFGGYSLPFCGEAAHWHAALSIWSFAPEPPRSAPRSAGWNSVYTSR